MDRRGSFSPFLDRCFISTSPDARAVPGRWVPLVYVKRSQLVVPGENRRWVPWNPSPGGAVDSAKRLFSTGQALYVWDVDGNEYGEPNLEFYQALERARITPWVDAGCRKPEDVMDVFFAGAASITIQLRHMEPSRIREVAEMSDAELFLGFTVEGNDLEKQIRPREVIEFAQQIQATGVVLYEGSQVEWRRAEDIAFELQRNGIPVSWASRYGSPNRPHAAASERFASVISLGEARP